MKRFFEEYIFGGCFGTIVFGVLAFLLVVSLSGWFQMCWEAPPQQFYRLVC